MVNRSLATWGIGLVLLVLAGTIALWLIGFFIRVTVTLVKLGVVVALGLAAVYVGRELYRGWSRAG